VEPVAIIGVGAILPDAPDAPTFWRNVTGGRYSISDVDPQRWDPALYYDPDPKAPDKTYSKIGGWVRDYAWEPLAWRLPIPPTVSDAMDEAQRWAVACTREVLADHGKEIDRDRTAVIIGNAMAGEKHYQTALRLAAPEIVRYLEATPGFAALPAAERDRIAAELTGRMHEDLPRVTEDTMPGELGNVMAGRIANLFNLHGPNYIVDAACASAMAAMDASIAGLNDGDFDTVITGGIDRNNGASSFIKFCAIGALSATGTRPFDAGADGFVMGEGGALFLLKRLADAERDGDRIYAVVRGIGGASDGKGKGITAPNPVGQRLAVERAWRDADLDPSACGMVEAHGTSTRVGDVVELTAIGEAFGGADLAPGSIALGSVKSNIGHLKAAAGSAGILKTVYAIHHGQLPPSLNFGTPNPNVDWSSAPFRVNTELAEWTPRAGQVRTAGVSSFGFGGTNFHAVLEEYVPGRIPSERSRTFAVGAEVGGAGITVGGSASTAPEPKAPLRGATVVGASDQAGLASRLRAVAERAASGDVGPPRAPDADDLAAPLRVAIDHADAAELADKASAALTALDKPAMWKPLRSRGVFHGEGAKTKVAFLYPGQGSQYVNMLAGLRTRDPIVAATIDHADRAMSTLLDRPLSSYFLVDADDPERLAQAELELRATEITQPAMLTGDEALTRMLAAYGIVPDMVMGHSLGEYAALVAAGSLTFDAALEAVSARGHEMASLEVDDPGAMAAVFAPIDEVQAIVDAVDGYVVLANVNSTSQSVIGGETDAVMAALAACAERGFTTFQLPVSHAFHTRIVALASEPLRRTLERLELRAPQLPVVSNVTGSFYPSGDDARERMLDLLADQVASPVQFVSGLQSLHAAGARVFVEVGPKRALQGLASDVLGDDEVLSLFTNHPKFADEQAFNQALCGLYAAGHGAGRTAAPPAPVTVAPPAEAMPTASSSPAVAPFVSTPSIPAPAATTSDAPLETATMSASDRSYLELGRALGAFLERTAGVAAPAAAPAPAPTDGRRSTTEPVAITGASIGLPGTERVFDDQQLGRILGGQQFIGPIPDAIRGAIADRRITRLVKGDDGQASFETIDDPDRVIKLAARSGELDLAQEFGIDPDRVAALGWSTQLAIGAGVDALRDAGIPIVQHYRTTGIGTQLPDRWGLPAALRDDTGVIFASAFPGLEEMTDEVTRYQQDAGRRQQRDELRSLRERVAASDSAGGALQAIDEDLAALERRIEEDAYRFDRRFLFRVLSMGHSQFAELIGARGPNTQINSACASTTQAVALAEDWIRAGRCRRVVIVAADDASSDRLLPWIGAGFLATGAAATDAAVEDAALPFDRRRHGMLIGMGAAGIVVESAEAARERGVTPICEVLGTVTANSAFHGTRLDVDHIGGVMEEVVAQAEARGVQRHAIAPETVFVSHETYTPARGGSAAAEIHALRRVFGGEADRIVIANTKGVTGHPMGVGVEDVVAIKTLETGLVPPVPNFREVDPELGQLNLSRGGSYPVRYALRLAAGFGSQISMMLLRWTPVPDGQRRSPSDLGFGYRVTDPAAWQRWLATVTGRADAQLEVASRWLRVVDTGPAAQPAAPAASTPVTVPAPASTVAVPAPAAAVAPAPAAAPAVTEDALEAKVLELVADQTGYPPDMLDLDLDLEADLGIDTVKQAELFVAVRDTFDIERDDSLQLRDYPTLSHVIGFVKDRSPAAADAVATPAPAAPSPAPAAPAQDPVEAQILALVAEQTGYPSDMLDLDLDLEADLGIDTVKQAELFVAVRETYDIERDDSLQLRDYPTLAAVIGFVKERVPELAAAPAAAPAAPAPGAAAPAAPAPEAGSPADGDPVAAQILSLVAEQTGYPPEMLDLDLDLEADLGIDTVKQAELFVAVRETYDIERDDSLQLRDYPTLAAVIGFVKERVPELAAPAPSAAPATVSSEPATDLAGPTPAEGADDPVAAQILSLVVEQTGYPPEMLDLDLDLEADLGIDTVKQAELFVAVRETYDIERDDTLQLRDYPTLAHVIGFVRERAPQLAETPAEAAQPLAGADEPAAAAPVAAEGFPRRVPVPVVRPPVAACVPTGVELRGARVVVLADHGGVADAVIERLEERDAIVLRVADEPSVEDLEAQLTAWREDGPIVGVLGLAGLDLAPFDGLDADRWREGLRVRVKLLATTARALYEDLTAGAFFLTGARLGGRFGYDAAGAQDVLGGAVSGFTKALAREREDATVKVVDVAADADAGTVAGHLIEEILLDPGVIEVGYADGLRWSVGLAVEDRTLDPDRALGPDDVVVVTGAAGSIVSAITADLAQGAGGGTFHLLDLTPAPDRDDPDLARFVDDPAGLKQDLAARIAETGERATPAKVNQALARIERSRAALDAVLAVEEAGGTAHWHQVDLTDGEAVGAAIAAALETTGRIDHLVHAGGLEISHFLPDKPAREYDLVFDVKADGLFHCLHAIGDAPLGNLVVFSSIAGRFGNGGQTDYSAANDLLCKTVAALGSLRPDTRGIALDWTAWGGIGMATRGSIPKMMEFAGIDMLPPEIGIPYVRHELEAAGRGGEVVVAGNLGLLLEERHATGGVDPDALRSDGGTTSPMLGEAVACTLADGLVTRRELTADQPFLDDHRIDGTPVLPGVMSVESFAAVAGALVPGWHVTAVENVAFDAPFKLYRDEPREAEISARLRADVDGGLVADCRLVGRRTLANGSEQVTEHATGRVHLAREAPEPATADVPAFDADAAVDAAAIYRIYFHGPTYQVLDRAWRDGELVVGELAADLPPNHRPEDAPTTTVPRLLELCFQAAGVHELGTSQRMALPARIDRLELFGPSRDEAPRYAVVRPTDGGADAEVVDGDGHVVLRLHGYGTVVLPDGPDEELVAPLREAMQ
jgi:acyl transferase domain-containing protein/acyl carrier protein